MPFCSVSIFLFSFITQAAAVKVTICLTSSLRLRQHRYLIFPLPTCSFAGLTVTSLASASVFFMGQLEGRLHGVLAPCPTGLLLQAAPVSLCLQTCLSQCIGSSHLGPIEVHQPQSLHWMSVFGGFQPFKDSCFMSQRPSFLGHVFILFLA